MHWGCQCDSISTGAKTASTPSMAAFPIKMSKMLLQPQTQALAHGVGSSSESLAKMQSGMFFLQPVIPQPLLVASIRSSEMTSVLPPLQGKRWVLARARLIATFICAWTVSLALTSSARAESFALDVKLPDSYVNDGTCGDEIQSIYIELDELSLGAEAWTYELRAEVELEYRSEGRRVFINGSLYTVEINRTGGGRISGFVLASIAGAVAPGARVAEFFAPISPNWGYRIVDVVDYDVEFISCFEG